MPELRAEWQLLASKFPPRSDMSLEEYVERLQVTPGGIALLSEGVDPFIEMTVAAPNGRHSPTESRPTRTRIDEKPSLPASASAELDHREATPVDDEDASWQLRSHANVVKLELPPTRWDIDGLLEADSGPVLLYGEPGAFKTFIALHAAYCVATGEHFLGRFAVRRRQSAIYVNFDAGSTDFQRRMKMLPGNVETLYCVSPSAFTLARLEALLKAHEEAFVVIDCFADIYSQPPNSEPGAAMRAFLRSIRRLFECYGCNGILTDHARRKKMGDSSSSDRYYGSSQKKATIRQMWFTEQLRQQDDNSELARVKIVCEKLSEGPSFAPLIAQFAFDDGLLRATYGGEFDAATAKGEKALQHRELIEPYLRDNPEGVTTPWLVKQTKLGENQVRAALKTPGIVSVGNGKARRYRLADPIASEMDEDDDDGA